MNGLQQLAEPAQPLPCETLSAIWAQLHAGERFAVRRADSHYLRALAVSLDDDVASLLLLKKLKLARELNAAALPRGLVVLNSFVEFTFSGGDRQVCQLVHSSAGRGSFWVGADSRLGTGLIGLRSGQAILWPDEQESLKELHVARVENCPGMGDWLRGSV